MWPDQVSNSRDTSEKGNGRKLDQGAFIRFSFRGHRRLLDSLINTVELQWLEHLLNHEKMFKTGEVRANKC